MSTQTSPTFSQGRSPGSETPTLSDALGLPPVRSFLVQHLAAASGSSYRVMDGNRRLLVTVQANEAPAAADAATVGTPTGPGNLGREPPHPADLTFAIVDPHGAPLASILKRSAGNNFQYALLDAGGRTWLSVHITRGLLGGLEATAHTPEGRVLMTTSGSLLRHGFAIRTSGGQDLAKVHEEAGPLREAYSIDLVGSIDPLYPLVYSVCIDLERGRRDR
jgi:hypothetical protein